MQTFVTFTIFGIGMILISLLEKSHPMDNHTILLSVGVMAIVAGCNPFIKP